MGRYTRSEGVQCLRIGCTAHTNKPKRGERLDATLTLTNSARNSLATKPYSPQKTPEFQRSDLKT